jgi:GNAT superfamily N-acetyltransferase
VDPISGHEVIVGTYCWDRALVVTPFHITSLDTTTWSDFAALVERHHGVWGGCWCLSFHEEGASGIRSPEERRRLKETRVREGRAHAALVYDDTTCVGWCQFGSTDELPRIKHRRAYIQGLGALPDWRITCFFVDSQYRHKGVSSAALGGAVDQIARLGGGRVESYPQEVGERSVSSSFLHNGTLAMFERHGFKRVRRLGKNHWVVEKPVAAYE